MDFEIATIRPERDHLFGASAGRNDLGSVLGIIEAGLGLAHIVAFDFGNVVSISGSYIRATVGWLLTCGRMHAEGVDRSDFSDPWAVRPLPVFPVVVGGSHEILWEIHDFLRHREIACALLEPSDELSSSRAQILGKLDEFLLATLRQLSAASVASAQELKDGSTEKITIGGWSNRLVALLANRLVARSKEGKTWNYEPIGKEHRPWA